MGKLGENVGNVAAQRSGNALEE